MKPYEEKRIAAWRALINVELDEMFNRGTRALWWKTPNPELEGLTPEEFLDKDPNSLYNKLYYID